MTDAVSLNDAQFEKVLTAIDAFKHGGIHWETVIPVFLSALLGMGVGIALEYFKSYREKRKIENKKKKEELTEINVATVAMCYNLEILIHMIFQNILPHYEDSHAAYKAANSVPSVNTEIAKFMAGRMGEYPRMMTTAPDLLVTEYDFLSKLSFAINKAPELLQQGNWFIYLSRILRRTLQDRNNQIETARRDGLNGVTFPAIVSAIQMQESISEAECIQALQLIERINIITQVLEKIGRTYKGVGQLSTILPPESLGEALQRLRAISAPRVAAMSAERKPNGGASRTDGE